MKYMVNQHEVYIIILDVFCSIGKVEECVIFSIFFFFVCVCVNIITLHFGSVVTAYTHNDTNIDKSC